MAVSFNWDPLVEINWVGVYVHQPFGREFLIEFDSHACVFSVQNGNFAFGFRLRPSLKGFPQQRDTHLAGAHSGITQGFGNEPGDSLKGSQLELLGSFHSSFPAYRTSEPCRKRVTNIGVLFR